MQPDTHLVQAWESLRQHWIIHPSGKGIPKTPIYSFLRLVLPPLIRPLLRLRIRGSHHIPRKGATILAANHLSHVDPLLVIVGSRRTTHYLAKDGHFNNPMLRTVMQSTGQIETLREEGGSGALSSAADILVANRAFGRNLRLCANMSMRFFAFEHLTISIASFGVVAKGFSQSTWQLELRACITCSACSAFGDETTTASSLLFLKSLSNDR